MAALVRGLFEYIYSADCLTIYPHIPPAVTALRQKDPIRFGTKKLYLSTSGSGPVSAVLVDGKAWTSFNGASVTLPYDRLPEVATIEIGLGGLAPVSPLPRRLPGTSPVGSPRDPLAVGPPPLRGTVRVISRRPRPNAADPEAHRPGRQVAGTPGPPAPSCRQSIAPPTARWRAFLEEMTAAGLADTYEAAHARLVLEAVAACRERTRLLARGAIAALPEVSARAADQAYADAALKLGRGLDAVLNGYRDSPDARKASIYAIYILVGGGAEGN